MPECLIEVKNLKKYFQVGRKLTIKALDGVSFSIRKGEILGIVGESGSGKSTLARVLLGIDSPTAGHIYYKGQDITIPSSEKLCRRDLQRNRQIIFQDSDAALNPHMTVEEIIAEPLWIHRRAAGKSAIEKRVQMLLAQVGLEESYKRHYPGELSGGQRQRVNIARSIALDPEWIIADEPIASLDLSMQAQIVNLFQDLQKERNFSFLFIAHDLSMVRFISDRIGVLYKGRLVEIAPAEDLFARPIHPYTQYLLSSVLLPDPLYEKRRKLLDFDGRAVPTEGVLEEVYPEHFAIRCAFGQAMP